MKIGQIFAMELEHEAANTRKMLERVPDASFSFKPHENSMDLLTLATHTAEVYAWAAAIVHTAELDFATTPYNMPVVTNNAELLALLDKSVASAKDSFSNAENDVFMQSWTMRNGETIYFTLPKGVAIRSAVMSHLIHHRGQLSVYLRLLNVPVPGMYGPSADEAQMM